MLHLEHIFALVLVFVTDANGIATAQTSKTDNGVFMGNALGKEARQVSLHLGSDFDKLADFCREERP